MRWKEVFQVLLGRSCPKDQLQLSLSAAHFTDLHVGRWPTLESTLEGERTAGGKPVWRCPARSPPHGAPVLLEGERHVHRSSHGHRCHRWNYSQVLGRDFKWKKSNLYSHQPLPPALCICNSRLQINDQVMTLYVFIFKHRQLAYAESHIDFFKKICQFFCLSRIKFEI